MEEFEGAILVSEESLERMKRELEELKTTGREQISERLRLAREHGDIMENAEFDAAKDAQGLMEARVRQLERTIRNAVVRESAAIAEQAAPGVIVAVREEGGEQVEEYYLATSPEDKLPGVRTVTTSSPLGSALVGKRAGESAVVEAPGGKFSVEVVSLRPS